MGSEYFAGYITEKALSVDNLFVFLIIMTSFRVPRENQQKVLLFGIVFSLIARTGFIFLGSALLNTFAWVFYLFGLALLLTAGNMLKPETEESHSAQNVVVRLSRRLFRTTDDYDGDRLFTMIDGRRVMTPMLLVMVAIGGTDLMFALDSIPAIFGLTQNVFVVFTATAFSLLGLRQLYFLLDGLLDRLIYLSYGLAAILAFIGAKLILHALHENNLPFINGGEHVDVVEISTGLSLVVILVVLVITVLASLFSTRGRTQTAMAQHPPRRDRLPGRRIHRRPGRARADLPAADRSPRPHHRPRPEGQAAGQERAGTDGPVPPRPPRPTPPQTPATRSGPGSDRRSQPE